MAFLLSPQKIPVYIKRYGYAFSWKRLWNFGKVMSSMGLSWVSRRPVVWGRPFMMMVEPTNYCNLKCPLCPSGNGEMTRRRGRMDLEDFKSMLDETGQHLILLMLWNQGEPFLNPCFIEMVRYARAKKIPTLTSTNGHYIRDADEARRVVESGLSEIIVSVDGVDQETYARYRVGGDLQRVLDGIQLLVETKKELGVTEPLINLQFIVMRHNEKDLAAAEQIAHDLEVDKFLVKTAQVYSSAEADEFLPEQEKFRRYEAQAKEELVVKGQPKRGCKVLWYSTMVNWNGAVAPCCFDKDVDFNMGQAFDDGAAFGKIWKGQAYTDFRRQILDDRRQVEMCRNCSEGYRGMFSLVKEMRG
jgi:radical SAM protein with 4Fe4S-binding SPASM domain